MTLIKNLYCRDWAPGRSGLPEEALGWKRTCIYYKINFIINIISP